MADFGKPACGMNRRGASADKSAMGRAAPHPRSWAGPAKCKWP